MNPEDIERIKSAHDEALNLTREERARFLEQQFPLDLGLQSEVLQLLQWHDEAGEFLLKPIVETLISSGEADKNPKRLGPYELLRPIGRGGFATVYLARRVDAPEKQVAIKVLNHLTLSEDSFQRFRREAEILSRLAHPNIVNFIEAETTEGSISYIVTDLVDGEPIDEFSKSLSQREKLTLFLRVCDGVFAAHNNLIVHRDIKPSNILVTKDGTPKLLDFGIAILIDEDSRLTQTGFEQMSVQYASPQQIRRERAITTSTDVYSLGVILYEMLAGNHPFSNAPHEIQASILCDEPAPLAHVERDLAAIVFKALEKTPERRYESVAHLRDDILRLIGGFPVQAELARPAYVARKFVMRHRSAFALATVLVLFSATAVLLVYEEAHKAQLQANETRELALTDLTNAIDFLWRYPGSLRAASRLRQRRLEVLQQLSSDEPSNVNLKRELISAYISYANLLGNAFAVNLGRTLESRKPIECAVSLAEELLREYPADPRSTGDLVVALGYLAENERDIGNGVSERLLRFRALALAEDYRKPGKRQTIESEVAYAVAASEAAKILALEGNEQRSLQLHRASVEVRKKVLEQAATEADKQRFSRGLSISWADLAESLLALRQYDAALNAVNEAEVLEHLLYTTTNRNVETRSMYSERLRLKGEILAAAGRQNEALPSIREAVQLERALLREDPDNYRNWRTLTSGLKALISALKMPGENAERRSLLRELVHTTTLAAQRNPMLAAAQRDREFADRAVRQDK